MKRAAAFLAATLALPFGHVAAQDRPAVPPPDSALYELPSITVTAARSPMPILSVPLAVTVVPLRRFQNGNGLRIDQTLAAVPGVLAQSRSGTADVRIVVRGFGARGAGDRSNAGTTRGVRILQDGFPETEPDGRTSLDLVDLAATQDVEVVRSNASALWGNAAGGVVNFSSVPYFERPFLSFEQAVGAAGLRREIARLGTRLGEARLFASAVRTDYDGWRSNSGSTRSLVNLGAVVPLAERTRLRVHAVAADHELDIPGPLTLAQVEANPRGANATYQARRERRHNRLGRLGVALEHEVGAGRAVSGMLFATPKYLQRSERGTFRDFTRYHVGGSLAWREERRLSDRLHSSLSLGLDEAYQDGAILFYSLTPDGSRGPELRDNKREGAGNFGGFLQERLALGQRVELTLGARYDAITYYNESYIDPGLTGRKSFTRVSPKLGLLYRLAPDQALYANVGGGVEAPAGNETDPASTFGQDTVYALDPLLEPIRSTTYEMGAKRMRAFTGPGLMRAIAWDVAAYWTDVTNEIVPYRGGRFYFTAGRVRRRGLEAGLQLQTAPRLTLAGALTLSDNRYRQYMVDSVHYGVPGRFADYGGNRVVGVPDLFASGSLTWAPRFQDILEVGLAARTVQRYFVDDANLVEVPAYTLLDATLATRRALPLPGGAAVRGFLRLENLSDRRYIASAFLNPDVVNGVPVAFEPGLPRQLMLSLALEWR